MRKLLVKLSLVLLLLAGLILALGYIPRPPALQPGEVLLKVSINTCPCPHLKVHEGQAALKAANRDPAVNGFEDVWLDQAEPFNFMRDGLKGVYWITGKPHGHLNNDEDQWIEPIFQIRAFSYATFELEGWAGLMLAGIAGAGLLLMHRRSRASHPLTK